MVSFIPLIADGLLGKIRMMLVIKAVSVKISQIELSICLVHHACVSWMLLFIVLTATILPKISVSGYVEAEDGVYLGCSDTGTAWLWKFRLRVPSNVAHPLHLDICVLISMGLR